MASFDVGELEAYGRRPIPSLVDQIAQQAPSQVFSYLPIQPDFEGETLEISFQTLARAINRCAWWIRDQVGSSDAFDTIAYLGPGDLSVFIAVLASIKTGHKILLCPPSQPIETHLSLYSETQCRILWTSAADSALPQQILSRHPMTKLTAPGLRYWLEDADVQPYPYEKSFLDSQDDPFVICITSGSTGMPKPVIMRHGTMSHHDLFVQNEALGGNPVALAQFAGKRVFLGMPLFHSAGLCFLVYSIYSGTVPVLPPPCGVGLNSVTAEVANAAHIKGNVDASFLNPAVITAICRNEQYLENLKRLKYLTFGGAPLARDVGNRIKDYTRLFVSFGATETGFYALELTKRDDWEYARPSEFMGCDFRHLGDGKYELHFVRKPELRDHQGVFSTFKNADSFTLNDVYSKHPSKENLWLYEGRSDDPIVLANGTKLNPLRYENLVAQSPLVSALLMYGSGRSRTGLIIEPSMPLDTQRGEQEFVLQIWPWIAEANRTVSELVRISRAMVIVTSAAKPILRTGKGSVRRKVTINIYEKEIEERYVTSGEVPI